MALNKVKEKATQIAASVLEAAVDDIELVGSRYQVKGVPDRGLSLGEVAEKAYSGDLDDIDVGLETTSFFKPADETFPFGTHISVVEVSPDTGEITLLRHISVDDCGNIITPFLVTGQVHGGLAQGIGQVILEELHYDESGELMTGTLNDYAVPRAHHFPMFETHHTTTTTPINPLGAKGIGEAATIGATPAAANAVIDALSHWGITHLDTPFTPEKVWRAIHEAKTTRQAAD
jgi:CO/xanthine dehydrogenase Mo-binding subunit